MAAVGEATSQGEADLVDRLRLGDEAAFTFLLERYHASMVRIARSYVSSETAAEDVVGDTWMAVVQGIERFEGRSSVKTWLFRILVNRAKTRGARESRSVPFSSLGDDGDDGHRSVDPDRFLDESHRWGGHWSVHPNSWRNGPELNALSGELRQSMGRALDRLPPMQQAVVTMRDVHGLQAGEVCETLEVSEANQRVLLHRGRSQMRRALESEFQGSGLES